MNRRVLQDNQNTVTSANLAAKLAIIGSAIATFGDALSTIAAVIALEESIVSDTQQQDQKDQDQKDQDQRLQMMQQQIDDLKNELSNLTSSKE